MGPSAFELEEEVEKLKLTVKKQDSMIQFKDMELMKERESAQMDHE